MENTTFLFALQKISTEQFALNEDVLNLDCNINLSSKFKFGIVPENRILAVSVKFMFEKESNPFIIVEVVCNFDIEQKSWNDYFSSEKKQIAIPKDIAIHLLFLSIGTTRGVLHAKTENTAYNKYFLPTLDVSKSILEDIVVKSNWGRIGSWNQFFNKTKLQKKLISLKRKLQIRISDFLCNLLISICIIGFMDIARSNYVCS